MSGPLKPQPRPTVITDRHFPPFVVIVTRLLALPSGVSLLEMYTVSGKNFAQRVFPSNRATRQ